MIIRLLIALFAGILMPSLTVSAQAVTNYADVAQVRLAVLEHDKAQGTAILGLQFTLKPGWHTYWRTPGEGGVPARFDWSASSGIDPHKIIVSWPWPQEFDDFGYKSYGYEGQVLLPISVKLTDGQAIAALNLDYAVCADVCVPLHAQLSVPIDDSGIAALKGQKTTPDFTNTLDQNVSYDGELLTITIPGGQGLQMIADNVEGLVFYSAQLNEKGQAQFPVLPSDYKFLIAGKMFRIGVLGEDGIHAVETIAQAPPL